jgi:uncharacterized protein (DUF1501 family)
MWFKSNQEPSMTNTFTSRRNFLRASAGASLLGAAAVPFGMNLSAMSAAFAQQAPSDYKALVCIFMFGGNDGHNTVLATDDATWNTYTAVRGPTGSLVKGAVPGAVLPLTTVGGSRHGTRPFALHPAMPNMQALFNTKRRLAVVPNVGTLLAPTTKQQYQAGSVALPPMLFSHNDQFNMWQAGGPEGATLGWGGLFGDQVQPLNGQGTAFTCISPSGTAVWLAGQDVVQYQVLPGSGDAVPIEGRDTLFGSVQAGKAFDDILQLQDGDGLFESEYKKVVRRSISAEQTIANAFNGVTLLPANQVRGDYVGLQLRAVARLIKAANNGGLPGVKRQVFFVSAGGFDTHNNQFAASPGADSNTHDKLLGRIDGALQYFHDELGDGLINKVTTFTASDFGRTLRVNGDGTDHGWGGHHLVMGGAVNGGEIHGAWPDLQPGGNDLVELGLNLIPRISVDQYGATLGRWFGLNDQQLLNVFPNLVSFPNDSYPHDLGFMKIV